jgi:hypothetical protein
MTWSPAASLDDVAPVAIGSGEPAFWRLLGGLTRALGQDEPIAYRYVLLLRFVLANAIALALVGAAAWQGWLTPLLTAEGSIYSLVIVAVFIVGLVWSAGRALQISRELNQVKRFQSIPRSSVPDYLRKVEGCDAQSRSILASSLRMKLVMRIAPVRHLANSLVLLGLIGTVIGFMIALSGVRPETASHVSAVGPMVSTLIQGMSVALHTTLVGSLLNIWLMANVRLLEGGTVKLLTATVELGERHVRA